MDVYFCAQIKDFIFIYTESDLINEIEEEENGKNRLIFSQFVYLLFRNYIYYPRKSCIDKERKNLYPHLSRPDNKMKKMQRKYEKICFLYTSPPLPCVFRVRERQVKVQWSMRSTCAIFNIIVQ
jgi:hypothetical protein